MYCWGVGHVLVGILSEAVISWEFNSYVIVAPEAMQAVAVALGFILVEGMLLMWRTPHI